MPKLIVWQKLTTEYKGRTIEGLYGVDNRTVIVRYAGNSKAISIGSSPRITTAQALLRELAEKAESVWGKNA